MLQEPCAVKELTSHAECASSKVGNYTGASDIASTTLDAEWPSSQTLQMEERSASMLRLATPGGTDGVDDIIEQIRMLRSSILPPGPASYAMQRETDGRASRIAGSRSEPGIAAASQPAKGAASPEGLSRASQAGEPGPTSYTPSLSSSPLRGTLPRHAVPLVDFSMPRSRTALDVTQAAHGEVPAHDGGVHSVVRPRTLPQSSASSPRGGDVAAGGGGAAPMPNEQVHHRPLSARRSPLRLRHTLWEERQIERCLRGWRSQASSSSQSSRPKQLFPGRQQQNDDFGPRTGSHQQQLPPQNHDRISATPTRVHLCFRAWRRLCAAQRAGEIATSVRVLEGNITRQLRRAVAHWHDKSQDKANQRTLLNLQATTRRLAVRCWRRTTVDRGRERALRDQVCMLKRVQLLRQATQRWATRTTSVVLWRSFRLRQNLRCLRLSFQVWVLAQAYCRQKVSDAQASSLILHALAKRSALRWWVLRARCVRSQNLLECHAGQRLRHLATHRAWRRWSHQTKNARQLSGRTGTTILQVQGRRKKSSLDVWKNWSFWRLQRQRRLAGHRTNRVQPRMLRNTMQLWVSVVRRKQRHNAALQKAKIVMALALKSRTLVSWLGVTNARARAVCVLRSLALVLSQDVLTAHYYFWRAAAGSQRAERERHSAAVCHHDRRILIAYYCKLRDNVAANQYYMRQSSRATNHRSALLVWRHIQLWRTFVTVERFEREQFRRASTHWDRSTAKICFQSWCVEVADLHFERARSQQAQNRRSVFLRRVSWAMWRDYIAFRRHKRHEQKSRACCRSILALRRHHVIRNWSRSWVAGRACTKSALMFARETARAVFAWGKVVLAKRRRVQRVENAIRWRRQKKALSSLHGFFRAGHLCRSSRNLNLLTWAFGLWSIFRDEVLTQAMRKVSLGLSFQSRRRARCVLYGLWEGMLEQRALRRRVSKLIGALQIVSYRNDQRSQARTLEVWWNKTEDYRVIDLAQLEHNLLQQKETCIQCWVQYCQQQVHKRSVHMVCNSYRDRRLLRSALQCWHSAHMRLCDTAEAVLRWAAGLATYHAAVFLVAWREYVMHRLNCRYASAAVIEKRRMLVWTTWQASLKRNSDVSNILAMAILGRQRSWLRAWLAFASAKQAQRRLHAIAIQAVRSSRQRQWIDRWSEAGRWHRLGHVAEEWDHQVISKQIIRDKFDAWFDAIHLCRKAEDVATRVSKIRARTHIRLWAHLKFMTEVRPRSSAKQVLKLWREACRRVAGHRLAIRKMPLQAGFKQLRVHQQEQARRRKLFEGKQQSILRARATADGREAVRCWRNSVVAQRKKKAWRNPEEFRKSIENRDIKSCLIFFSGWAKQQRAIKTRVRDHAAKTSQLAVIRQRRYLDKWRNDWRDAVRHQLAIKFLRSLKPPVPPEQICAAWAVHSKKRSKTKTLEQTARQQLAVSARSRIFDKWTKVYEHRSSSYYATKILSRQKSVRIFHAWFQFATFRKRFDVHVSHVQVLQDTRLLRNSFRMWDNHLHEHRCIAAVFLDRWKHWSSALVGAWRKAAHELKIMRAGIHDLRILTSARRNRRRADLMRLASLSTLMRRSHEAWACWVRKTIKLRTRSLEFESQIGSARASRRLCGWAMHSREQERVANPAGGMACVFLEWTLAHQREMVKARSLIRMCSSRNALLLSSIMKPWWDIAWDGRDAREAYRQFQYAQIARRRQRGIFMWMTHVRRRRGHITAAHQHRTRWTPRLLRLWVFEWRKVVSHERIASKIVTSRDLRSLQRYVQAWDAFTSTSLYKTKSARALQDQRIPNLGRKVLNLWSRCAGKQARLRKLVNSVERARNRWVSESEWRSNLASDPVLHTMFSRFVMAFDQQRAGFSSAERPLPAQREAFETLVSLIWERQQLSVALGRLKGYPQPWVLGCWRGGPHALLSPDSPYYMQSEIRLSVMVARLEVEQSPDDTLSLYAALYSKTGQSIGSAIAARDRTASKARNGVTGQLDLQQRVCMWQALADLMVVYHPGWPSVSHSAVGALGRPASALQAPDARHDMMASAPSATPFPDVPLLVDGNALAAAALAAVPEHDAGPLLALPPPSSASEAMPAVGGLGWGFEHQRHDWQPGVLPSLAQCRTQVGFGQHGVDDTPHFGFRPTFGSREPAACAGCGAGPAGHLGSVVGVGAMIPAV